MDHAAPAHRAGWATSIAVWPVSIGLAVALAGCRPSQPDTRAFEAKAEQSVSDMLSEVATARLVARQSVDGQLVGRYAQVSLVYCEEAAGAAADSLTQLQPPAGSEKRYRTWSKLLSEAQDGVTRTRIALTRSDGAATREAMVDLADLATRLRDLDAQLEAASP